MRRKKHKHTRRAVSFFKVHFGFHEPYKVLLDGNFVHATHQSNLSDLNDHVPRLLGGRCKLYTTKCVTTELRALGPDFAAAAAAVRGYELQKCGHAEPVAAAACLAEQIGSHNATHWWLATQDQTLRKQVAKIPGCPCLFASVNGLHLEEPSDAVKGTVRQVEEAQSSIPKHERKTEALQDLEQIRPRLVTSVKYRRQKIKGPNPLSVKKKVKKVAAGAPPTTSKQAAAATAPPPQAGGAEGAGAAAAAAAAVRKRKRRRTGAGEPAAT